MDRTNVEELATNSQRLGKSEPQRSESPSQSQGETLGAARSSEDSSSLGSNGAPSGPESTPTRVASQGTLPRSSTESSSQLEQEQVLQAGRDAQPLTQPLRTSEGHSSAARAEAFAELQQIASRATSTPQASQGNSRRSERAKSRFTTALNRGTEEVSEALAAYGINVGDEKIRQTITAHPALRGSERDVQENLIDLGKMHGAVDDRSAFMRGVSEVLNSTLSLLVGEVSASEISSIEVGSIVEDSDRRKSQIGFRPQSFRDRYDFPKPKSLLELTHEYDRAIYGDQFVRVPEDRDALSGLGIIAMANGAYQGIKGLASAAKNFVLSKTDLGGLVSPDTQRDAKWAHEALMQGVHKITNNPIGVAHSMSEHYRERLAESITLQRQGDRFGAASIVAEIGSDGVAIATLPAGVIQLGKVGFKAVNLTTSAVKEGAVWVTRMSRAGSQIIGAGFQSTPDFLESALARLGRINEFYSVGESSYLPAHSTNYLGLESMTHTLKARTTTGSLETFKYSKLPEVITLRELDFYSKTSFIGEHNFLTPGPLPEMMAETFVGYNYRSYRALEDITVYKAGNMNYARENYFSFEPPVGELQARIDRALPPVWLKNGRDCTVDTVFTFQIKKGTIVHVGDIASQGGPYLGGTRQIVVDNNWANKGLKVLDAYPIGARNKYGYR